MEKRYFVLNKPYGTLCQFTGEKNDVLLGDLYAFPRDVYSVGRLDKDSEGLLLLTNDNEFKTKILDPHHKTSKTYHVQIEGIISEKELKTLKNGTIVIKHNKKEHKVSPAKCSVLLSYNLPERNPPIRQRKNIPTTWIALEITEGKNRQVRKMTAAVNHPTLRLVRVRIGQLNLGELKSGAVKEIDKQTAYLALK